MRAPSDPPAFDAATLEAMLTAPHADVRTEVLNLLAQPAFVFDAELPRQTHRERVLEGLKLLAAQGLGSVAYPQEFGGRGSPGSVIAVLETLGLGDLSVMVKYGVQFGLWGGSIYQLGTAKHHQRWLRDIGTLALPGAYAMTEIGHGSNVRDLETKARYLPDTDEFEIHTPHAGAGKEWIGNAALHGRMAVVFAQLEVTGEYHGVHALVVPLRDEAGGVLPGIRIEDNGAKVGLNGIDNGRIWFDRVRVPRDHLLDRFGRVDDDGCYVSPIASEGRRFFTMLGTLVAGRISIAGGGVSVAKTALTIAVRYSMRRRQFGPDGQPERPIFEFTTHRRALMPRLAATYGLHFAVRDLTERFDRVMLQVAEAGVAEAGSSESGERETREADLRETELREIEVAAAGLKAATSWHAIDTVQVSREAMGGRGYRADNRLGRLRDDADIFTTFEGANVVLLQLVAKGLLTRFRSEMGDLNFAGLVRYVAERAQHRVAEANPVAQRRTDPEHLRDPRMHEAALRYREERLTVSAARRLKRRIDDGIDPFDALNEVQDHLVSLALAHVERQVHAALRNAVARAPSPGISETLASLAALYALERIESDAAWYLEANYFEPAKSRAVRAQVTALCHEVAEHAELLIDAFGIPDEVLRARDGLRGGSGEP